MSCRRRRFFDDFLESFGEVGREGMAAGIDVDGWVEGLNIEGFSNASLNPILFRREDGDVFFTKMVVMLTRMLQHSRFVMAKGVGGSGEMLLEAGADRSLGLTDICARA